MHRQITFVAKNDLDLLNGNTSRLVPNLCFCRFLKLYSIAFIFVVFSLIIAPPHVRSAEGALVVQEVSGLEATPIPLKIRLTTAPNQYKYFVIYRLPDGFRISSGTPIAFQATPDEALKEGWLIPIPDIETLQLIPTREFVGRLELQLLLFKQNDSKAEKYTVSVNIEPRSGATETASTVPTDSIARLDQEGSSVTDAPDQGQFERRVSREEEDSVLKRANEFLANADIASARLLYQAMANKGSARAAFAMGQTYDPEFLSGFVVSGLKPDIDEAIAWYKKATELGSPEAKARLSALDKK